MVLKRLLSRIKSEPFLIVSLLLAAVVYGLISFVNHYCFRTYTLDLGAYTNALYDYAHGSFNDSTTFKELPENLLADHFDLYLPLFSPLVYLFGTYTLLVVQLCAVLLGAMGVYRYLELRFPDSSLKKYGLLYFLFFFGIFAAFSFDYHSNVVATMVVPWIFLAYEKRKWKQIILLSVFFLIAKENMALWLVFLALGWSYLYRKDRVLRNVSFLLAGLSIVYFVVITGVVMPALSRNGTYHHFHYTVLGADGMQALKHLCLHPLDSLYTLFVNHTVFPQNDYVKAEFWIVSAVCGLFCLRKPVFLLMLIPVVAQKLYHDNAALWGINQHYAIELAPLLTLGSFEAIATMRNRKWRTVSAVVAVILSFVCSIRVMDNTVAYAEKARIRIYKAAHYNREFDIRKAREVLAAIPEHVPVSAQSPFVPHLALRPEVYQFPVIRNARYILLSPVNNPYPLKKELYVQKVDSLMNSSYWKVVTNRDSFILLKKNDHEANISFK